MTKVARAVIGAAYGDEGKGRTIEWLAAQSPGGAVVVRSNGGAQAGHTVVRPDGIRHVFHHLGSGALVGAATHLSRFMVSHPMKLPEEVQRIAGLGGCIEVTADPRGLVTTPWDMMVNQAIEMARGDGRHGSCGLGFGETVARAEDFDSRLTVGDLAAPDLAEKLRAIRDEWLPARMAQAGFDPKLSGPLDHAGAPGLFAHFLEDCRRFLSLVTIRDDAALGQEHSVIFEGAQGLRLDRNYPEFPYLTRSNTGIANMAAIAREAGIEALEPIYVTRCYLTRHGRGPMPDERDIAAYFKVDDATNQPNPWQETLRFGLLDPQALAHDIRTDLAKAPASISVRPSLAVTCLDQAADGQLSWRVGAAVKKGGRDQFLAALADATGLAAELVFEVPVNVQHAAETCA
ncbi:adenylosuccinate synthetase [Novosphingobium sp. BL-8A]|uniref:adenylosuccinate synthetase n=1 Tax=Novosphingobium sp. BL-8A TaxID=3127639 RepID=UPI003756C764